MQNKVFVRVQTYGHNYNQHAFNRYSGAEPTLSLEELRGFIEEVENLPCTIPEYYELKVS